MRCIAAFYASAVAVGAGAPVASQPAEHPGCQDAPTETVTSTFRKEHAWPGALTKIDNCGLRIIADHVVRDPLGAHDGLRVPDTVTRFEPNGAPPQQGDVTPGPRRCAAVRSSPLDGTLARSLTSASGEAPSASGPLVPRAHCS
jgi:hypothetical protein